MQRAGADCLSGNQLGILAPGSVGRSRPLSTLPKPACLLHTRFVLSFPVTREPRGQIPQETSENSPSSVRPRSQGGDSRASTTAFFLGAAQRRPPFRPSAGGTAPAEDPLRAMREKASRSPGPPRGNAPAVALPGGPRRAPPRPRGPQARPVIAFQGAVGLPGRAGGGRAPVICGQGARAPSVPRAPASDRPPSAAPGPRSVLPAGVAPGKGTGEPGSAGDLGALRLLLGLVRPPAPTTLARSREGTPARLNTFAARIPPVHSPDGARGTAHPQPQDLALRRSSRAREQRKRWIRAALWAAGPLLC